MATPSVVQFCTSSANPPGLGQTGNGFIIPLPNPVQAGNCIILGITWQQSRTVSSISDNINGTWGAVLKQVNGGTGNFKSAVYAFPNAGAGQTAITVTLSGTTIPFQYTVMEVCNIKTSSPSGGTSGALLQSGSTVSAGSFTPTNNNANGGNFIFNYVCLGSNAGSNSTGWTPMSGWTLLDGDIAWTDNQGVPHASQCYVQTTSAAINPTITTGDATDQFNTVAVAFQAASAGAGIPAGIHINAILHFTMGALPNPWKLQTPATGNLRFIVTTTGGAVGFSGVTDSDGNTWTQVPTTLYQGSAWYCANQSPSPNLTISIANNASVTTSVRFYDIQGADTSPYDTYADVAPTPAVSVTSVAHQPDITPNTSNGLVIAALQIGNGPGTGVTSPTGAVFDLCHYTNENDGDLMENADGNAHLYNSSTAAENWTWSITSRAGNSVSSMAVAFKAPANTDVLYPQSVM